MKVTNNDIFLANKALFGLSKEKMPSKVAFRLFKLKKLLEDEVDIMQKSLEGKSDDDIKEVLEMENEINIDKIKASDLGEVNFSIDDVFSLEKFIDFNEEDSWEK